MEIKKLTEKEYRQTFSEKMFDVTENAEAIIDIWPYAEYLHELGLISKYVLDNHLVEYVYRDSLDKYDHVLIQSLQESEFVIIIVDMTECKILGFHILHSNAKKFKYYKISHF